MDSHTTPRRHGSNVAADVQTIIHYARTVFGSVEGRAHIAVGVDPYSDGGKHKHRDWWQSSFRWPDEADTMARELARASDAGHDAYCCPYLMHGDKRHPAAVVVRRLVHADIDGPLDPELVRGIPGAFAVSSGSAGHGHCYVPVGDSLPDHWHRELCRGLGRYLGHADAKISANDVLRPPGTYNMKPTTRGEAPAPVRWLVEPVRSVRLSDHGAVL